MVLLAACNHSILSYGTFRQWVGLLAGVEVVVARGVHRTKERREQEEGFKFKSKSKQVQ